MREIDNSPLYLTSIDLDGIKIVQVVSSEDLRKQREEIRRIAERYQRACEALWDSFVNLLVYD